MKADRIIWGIILLFVGSVLLLENFDVIDFYWRSVWRFWPIFLIIAGVNVLFSKNKSQLAGYISIAVLVVTLGFLFYRGQQKPDKNSWVTEEFKDLDFEDGDRSAAQRLMLSEPYTDTLSKAILLNISGGGTSFDLDGGTDSLIIADVQGRKPNFSLVKMVKDSLTTLTLKMQDKNGKGKWSLNGAGNDVDLRLNKIPEWNINMNMGAGEVNFDLSDYRVRKFKFDGGAAALDIKIGALLPITDVFVKTGVADVKIKVPKASGCRIQSKTGLSARDFSGFTKLADGSYETPNYKTSIQKIFINLDGGLSNFEVKQY